MKRSYSIILLTAICSLVSGQQIAEIIEYTPAPGQFINTASGEPEAAESLIQPNGGLVSLGGFGGFIIFRLAEPIQNDPNNPYGVDFTIFGNALPHWAEPGVVSVMKDENENGIPDETWYELAGSDHFFTGTILDYSISYTNPHTEEAVNIQWSDNQGAVGYLLKNNFQMQSYYPDPLAFPSIGESICEFTGTKISPVLDFSNPLQAVSHSRLFGYADNNARIDPGNPLPDNPYLQGSANSGGDGMDISWALDGENQYVDLDQINFIKVYSAVNANGGILGEISTELSLVVDIEPSEGYPIPEKIISVKGLPSKIIPEAYELEYAVFYNGRYMEDETVTWTTDAVLSRIDSEYYLLAEGEETLTLIATLDSDPSISTSFSTEVYQPVNVAAEFNEHISVYPNPCKDFVMIERSESGSVELISFLGKIVYVEDIAAGSTQLDVRSYPAGIYFLRCHNAYGIENHKVIIFR
ncbi:T9SS type A sorting domain-containing protein [Bacteroidota bacterium]